jgi:hypothetical protein
VAKKGLQAVALEMCKLSPYSQTSSSHPVWVGDTSPGGGAWRCRWRL